MNGVGGVEAMGDIFVCPKTDIKISRLEELIEKAELKIGVRPVLVCVDYVQLVPFESKSDTKRSATFRKCSRP